MMNEKLDWTQKLGDAFLAQQKDVMDAVQRLRAKAQAAGQPEVERGAEGHRRAGGGATGAPAQPHRAPAAQQTIIKIEPANPQVVYVPTYNPTVVYGAWPYPAYPPYYYYPPGYVAGRGCSRSASGMAVGARALGRTATGATATSTSTSTRTTTSPTTSTAATRPTRSRPSAQRPAATRQSGSTIPSTARARGTAIRAPSRSTTRQRSAGQRASREQFRGRAEQGATGRGAGRGPR